MDGQVQVQASEHLLATRHSCRGFLPDELPQALGERILESAQRTASWCNTQPWQLSITRADGTRRLRAALREAARAGGAQTNGASDIPFPDAYRGIYLERRRDAAFRLFDAVGVARGDRVASEANALRNFDLFGAPHVAIVTMPRDLATYGAMDCAAWVANFMLVAHAHGVASIAQASLARYSDVMRRHLDINQDHQVVCGVSFGLADAAHPANGVRTLRAAPAAFVKWVDQ
jgi:nitroreductase